MSFALTRNRTFRAVDELGMYRNIRTLSTRHHVRAKDGHERYVTPPVPPLPQSIVCRLPATRS